MVRYEGEGLRVIKLGGSLLDWPDWPQHLREWLEAKPARVNIIVVGGGPLADVVRGWDGLYSLDAELAHRLALDTMSVTARLMAGLLNAELTAGWTSLLARLADPRQPERGGSLVVFDPLKFLQRVEPELPGPPLTHDWRTTSDSIAARVAEALAAWTGTPVELVLLKSALPAGNVATLRQAAEAGYVDEVFPSFADRIERMRCVNLRAPGWPEWISPNRS